MIVLSASRRLIPWEWYGKVALGQRAQTSGAVPHLAGTVERVGEASYPEELLLRLDAPLPPRIGWPGSWSAWLWLGHAFLRGGVV